MLVTREGALGDFGDVRRAATGTRLIERVMETGSLVIRKLGRDRAGEIAIHRFLSAASVTCGEMVATLATRTAAACTGRRIVAAQDTTEINFAGREERRRGLGPAGDGMSAGFFIHPVIDHDKLRLYAARGMIGTGINGPDDIDRVVELLESRGIELRGEHVALVVGMTDEKVRVTNTAQIRIEEGLAAEARRAAMDRSGALSTRAIQAAVARSGLDFTTEPEHGQAQLAAIYALGQGGALTLLTGVAGSGKTTLLQPLVSAWKADTRYDGGGREVVGIATALVRKSHLVALASRVARV